MRFSALEKFGFATIIAIFSIFFCNLVGNLMIAEGQLEEQSYKLVTEKPMTLGSAKSIDAVQKNDLASLLSLANSERGGAVFRKCKSCHTVDKGGKNTVGPNLWNVLGQKKAGATGFGYSKALAGMGGTWTFRDLDAFLANPKAFIKGTKMSYRGLKNPIDRASIIIYLRSLSDRPVPLPKTE